MREIRCPRCGGFMYSSFFAYGRMSFKSVLHCSKCGRDWQMVIKRVNGRKKLVMEPFAVHAIPGMRKTAYVR